jgi:hypothetical protein
METRHEYNNLTEKIGENGHLEDQGMDVALSVGNM